MRRLYLDCEFNGYGGNLISIALVDGSDTSLAFYYGLRSVGQQAEWVEKNVLPVLDASFMPFTPVTHDRLCSLAVAFLRNVASSGWVEVVADHPADFAHLNQLLDGWSAQNEFKDLPFQLRTLLVHSGELDSAVPHNALEDALALARWGEKELGA